MNIDKVNVSLSPGTYFVKDKFFVGGGSSQLTGNGVTIVLTKDATATVAGGGTISLTAPTTGPTAGITLYFPSRSVIYSNNDSNASDCTRLIAWRVRFEGGSRFQKNCQGTGVSPIGGSESTPQLVE